jgi:bacterial/archaeal transporter family protein
MQRWVIFAFLSACFAGLTAVIAKQGMVGISAELGLFIRTLFVCAFVILFAMIVVPVTEFKQLAPNNYLWLGLSGLATTGSWIFYYKALKDGDVATVALIDKGSVIIAILLAWLILKEAITLRVVLGASFILVGMLIISHKPK